MAMQPKMKEIQDKYLARDYDGRMRMHHLDVYRLDHLQEAIDLGLAEPVRQLLEAGQDPLAVAGGGPGDLLAAALLLGPQGVDLGDQAAAGRVGLQQPVDQLGDPGAALGQGGLDPLGVVADGPQIQHALRLPDRRSPISELQCGNFG